MSGRWIGWGLIGALAGWLAGCASAPRRPAELAHVSRIAVLPVKGASAPEPLGPALARRMVQRWLAVRGYVTVPLSVVDDGVVETGVRDPLGMKPDERQALTRRTGADAFADVELLAFRHANQGYYVERRVALAIRLIDARTGRLVWQDSDEVLNRQTTSNPVTALTEYVRGWGREAIESALQSPLYPEMNELVSRMLRQLPPYQL